MKYYIDTEFLEGTQTRRFMGMNFGQTKPTIDLISIGIVAEDGREYYAISKDFNLWEAWNRYEVKEVDHDGYFTQEKVYWIRENVLKPIYFDLLCRSLGKNYDPHNIKYFEVRDQDYVQFKSLVHRYGKSNTEIAEEVKEFCLDTVQVFKKPDGGFIAGVDPYKGTPEFYGYFADYDWVAFCWLFGKMMDLPTGFPMYCRDLKQELDPIAQRRMNRLHNEGDYVSFENALQMIKDHADFPKEQNEHNALADARWNLELHKFLNTL